MDAHYPLGPPELPGHAQPAEPVDIEPPIDEPDVLNEHWHEPGDPDGLVAKEEEHLWHEQQEERTASLPAEPSVTAPRKRRRLSKVLIVLIVLVAATIGVYAFGSYKATPTKTSSNPSTTKKQAAQVAVTPTKHYDSSIYTLGFDYPGNWLVVDTTTKLTVTSPAMSLPGVTGTSVSAHVVVSFQNQQTAIEGYPANGAVAALESDKVTYTQPTSVQRAQTYVSYLSYSQTNGLDALYVTGDNGYQKDQQIPMSDVIKGNPLIRVAFETCASDCTTGTPTAVTLSASSYKATTASTDVTAILQSITLN